MLKTDSVMILGSGRLSYRLTKSFDDRGLRAICVGSKEFKEVEETEVQESSMDYAKALLAKRGIGDISAICIVDGEDAVNIYLLMAVLATRNDIPIFISLFNENLISKLTFRHRNIKVFDPADVVSKFFAQAIPDSCSDESSSTVANTYDDYPRDSLVWKLSLGFMFLISTGTVFFRITESATWQKSLYLVITVITSVNFSDAELTNYNFYVQNLRMGLMLATYAYVILAIAFIVDQIVKRRTDVLVLGRKRYSKRGHVIVCGLGRVGYAIIQKLVANNEDIIVIESDPDNKYLPALRSNGISVLVGDATLTHYLIDAGVVKSKALICAIDSDMTNLEIGLNARAENNNIRLILRISDNSTAQEMQKRFNINYVFSKSFATAKFIFESLCREFSNKAEESLKTTN